jgi:hypothetical protein
MDGAPCAAPLSGPAEEVTVCPMAAVAVAAANVSDKRKTRRPTRMPASLSWLAHDHTSVTNFIPKYGSYARLFAAHDYFRRWSASGCARHASGAVTKDFSNALAVEDSAAETREYIQYPRNRLASRSCPCDEPHRLLAYFWKGRQVRSDPEQLSASLSDDYHGACGPLGLERLPIIKRSQFRSPGKRDTCRGRHVAGRYCGGAQYGSFAGRRSRVGRRYGDALVLRVRPQGEWSKAPTGCGR